MVLGNCYSIVNIVQRMSTNDQRGKSEAIAKSQRQSTNLP